MRMYPFEKREKSVGDYKGLDSERVKRKKHNIGKQYSCSHALKTQSKSYLLLQKCDEKTILTFLDASQKKKIYDSERKQF